MCQRVIQTDNVDQILDEIKHSTDTLFDFSKTDFRALGVIHFSVLSAIFDALNSLPHPFFLKLNHCTIEEDHLQHPQQIKALTLGLSTTKNMHGFEFIRSLSPHCPVEIFLKIAESLSRNYEIKSIMIDGFRVTPSEVCEVLTGHPTVHLVFIDGLLKLNRQSDSNVLFLKSAHNEPFFNTLEQKQTGK